MFKYKDNNGNWIELPELKDGKIQDEQLKHIPSNMTITLSSSSWSSDTQTVQVPGVTAASIVQISAASKADADAWTASGLWCTAQGAGTLTFTAETTPTENVVLNVLVIN